MLPFLRYTQPPADLFGWFQPYLEDEEVSISGFKFNFQVCLAFVPMGLRVFSRFYALKKKEYMLVSLQIYLSLSVVTNGR
jgi:hypothetical protein